MANRKKRSAKLFAIIILVVALISIVTYLILEAYDKAPDIVTSGDVFLYTPDYDSDIMSEESYTILDRSIKYSDGFGRWDIYNGTTVLTDTSIELYLIDYIHTLVAGDAEKLRTFYSEELIKKLEIPQKMTEQRIYETVFHEISFTETEENGVPVLNYEFKVEYKIQRNDGTFRKDLESDAVKAQYLTIKMIGDYKQIVSVVQYAIPK